MATRRALLGQLALGLGVLACRASLAQPAENAVYAGIETAARSGVSTASFFAASGARLASVPLDFRAHGLARTLETVAVFPRRPGDRFALLDRATLDIRAVIRAPEGRHFFGHGAFTRDGRTLLVTENDLDTLQGHIGAYEIGAGVRRVGQIALPRSGPHEITRHPELDVFFVALGGLQTHPAYGRTPLNQHDFRSEIVALEYPSATLTQMGLWPGTEGISLRHLAVDANGRLYVGGQVQDPARAKTQDVVWMVKEGAVERLDVRAALKGYVSSVAAYGTQVVVTSKEAGLALRLQDGQELGRDRVLGAGAAACGPGLVAVSGYSELRINQSAARGFADHEFDNHGLALV